MIKEKDAESARKERAMAVFFTSDPHFGHANIIQYCNRPFVSAEEMDQTIIERWNERVGPSDTLYCLGDWCLWRGSRPIDEVAAAYRERVNCGRIIFVFGNHDRHGRHNERFCRLFESVHDLLEIKIDGQPMVLCHYAMRVWNKSHHGAYHLYGHSHGSLPDDPNSRSFDCGVDCFNFYPVSLEEVAAIMAKKQWRPIDHHGANV
jgi:calcineurin-like phosphoesterase family protein